MGNLDARGGFCVACVLLAVSACKASDAKDDSTIASAKAPIVAGVRITDASDVGVVYLEFFRNSTKITGGSGVLLTNGLVLTAAHVAERRDRLVEAPKNPLTNEEVWLPADEIRITLAGAAEDHSEDQVRIFKNPSGSPTNSLNFPPMFFHPGWQRKHNRDVRASQQAGNDGAMILADWPFVSGGGQSGPFRVSGSLQNFRRALADRSTEQMWNLSAECFGYGRWTGCAQESAGVGRVEDFTILPYPAFSGCDGLRCNCDRADAARAADTRCNPALFSVGIGGGSIPNGTPGEDLLPTQGDSGGPCIDHTTGELWGILSAGNGKCDEANEVWYTSVARTQSFGTWVRSFVPTSIPPLSFDIDGDRDIDHISFVDSGGSLAVNFDLTGNSTTTYDTGIPSNQTIFGVPVAAAASLVTGDFNHDGVSDLMALVAGQPFYFDGGASFNPFNMFRDPITSWFPPDVTDLLANPFGLAEVGDFNQDNIEDVAFTREDGTREVFFGNDTSGLSTGVNSNSLASLRGFNYDGDGFEDVAIGAPGADFRGFCTKFDPATHACLDSQPVIQSSAGAVHILQGDPAKNSDPTQRGISFDETAVGVTPNEGDSFGAALAWGNFFPGSQHLAVGAPGTDAQDTAGAPLRNTGAAYVVAGGPDGAPVLEFTFTSGTKDQALGTALAAGDFNNDFFDDLVIGAPGRNVVANTQPPYVDEAVCVRDGTDDSNTAFLNQTCFFPEDFGFAPGVPGRRQRNFGWALDAGDFNCDGVDDLAIGMPGLPDANNGAGAVVVLYGAQGQPLSAQRYQLIDKSAQGVPGAGLYDDFGSVLAVGNFNGDYHSGRPCLDLAVGHPGYSAARGKVTILYGGAGGLNTVDTDVFQQGSDDVPAASGNVGRFGISLSPGHVNNDGFDDLVVGAQGDGLGSGSALIFLGGGEGPIPSPQKWEQGATFNGVTIPETPEAILFGDPPHPYLGVGLGDYFGSAVGGTSNGLTVIAARREGPKLNDVTNPEANTNDWSERNGWVGLFTTQNTSSREVILTKAVARTAENFSIDPGEQFQFGSAITRPRPFTDFIPRGDRYEASEFFSSSATATSKRAPALASFDRAGAAWTSADADVGINFEQLSEGSGSLETRSSGTVRSPDFRTTDWDPVGDAIGFDVLIPESSSVPFVSHLRLTLSVPEAGLQGAILGEFDMDDVPQGEWVGLKFALADNVRAALLGQYEHAFFEFAVIVPPGASVFLDNMKMLGRSEQRSFWSNFHAAASRRGVAQTNGPQLGTIAWSAGLGSDVRSSPAVGNDGTLYVGTMNRRVTAVKPDGSVKWTFSTLGSVQSSPALDSHGRLFVGCDDRNLYALDAKTGSLLWKFTSIGRILSSPVVDAFGLVYFGSEDGRVYALDAATGASRWSFQTLGLVRSSPALGPNRVLYVGSTDHQVYALRTDPALPASSRLLWKKLLGGDVETAPAVGPGPDYPVYVNAEDTRLYKLEASTGAILWSFKSALLIATESSPAVAPDGSIVFGSDLNKVTALLPNGSVKWTYSTFGQVNSSPAIGADGVVYVAADDGSLYALRPDAGLSQSQRLLFKTSLGFGFARSSPAIGGNGRVYVGSDADRLHAIGP